MKNLLKLLVIVAMVFTFAIDMDAQNDIKLSVQGTLKDANGAAIDDGPQDLIFRLYNTSSGGTHLWEESASVQVTGGVYSHNLGSVDPSGNALDPNHFSSTVYVGVTVNGTELSPRTELTYAPYTLYVGFAGNGMPVGGVTAYAGLATTPPPGWMVCDGRAMSSDDYPALFAAIGTSWGDGSAGDGATFTTDFNLPDLRGMFLRGVDDGAGNDPDAGSRVASAAGGSTGDKVGALQADEFKSHNHSHTLGTSSAGSHTHTINGNYADGIGGGNSSDGDYVLRNGDGTAASELTASAGAHTHTITGSISANGGSETRPKNVGVVYIIKI